ncbi:MAG: glycoside hydrolase family 3 C-terminal domain-containing protein [Gemmatimonadetes bacterium]|nr:glycoside hydrolase family 3 C-terminal domain-containing protein [Gemmatimonadota bacterium]
MVADLADRSFPCRRSPVMAAVVLASSLLAAGCAAPARPASPPQPATATATSEDPVEWLLSRMTLAEKVGQMTQPDLESIQPAEVTELHIGSVLSGGNSDPEAGNSMEAWTDMYDRYQRAALASRLGTPILYGVDAVHGHSNVVGAVVFPHNIGLGATRNPGLVRRIAEVTGKEMRATGVQWTFSPAVSVPRDERWGRTYEGFSEDPALVSELGAAAVLGYQRGDLGHPLAVLATAKHYLGDGGTVPGTSTFGDSRGLDQGDMRLSEDEMRRIHLHPYRAAVDAGVGSVMPSYSSWNGHKMSGDRYLLTSVLKGELGFEGFLISDYNAIQQLHHDFKTAIAKSVNAGMDMAMVPSAYRDYIRLLIELVEEGGVPMSRIDDAVRRILRVKDAMGLLDPDGSYLADRSLQASFGSPEHREVAREAVRQSLVLLKNERGTLPLARNARIHVAGVAADDIGIQSGGWTISWQGQPGDITTGGTTILEGIRAAAGTAGAVTYSEYWTDVRGADAIVVVIGEAPYAEGVGDRMDLSLDTGQVALVRRMADTGIPVVVVLISGRPLLIDDALELSDAFVAAWLPGTEGAGVADVLFGDHRPTGRLSFTWPRSMSQLPLNLGDDRYDPLFPFGYGLRY